MEKRKRLKRTLALVLLCAFCYWLGVKTWGLQADNKAARRLASSLASGSSQALHRALVIINLPSEEEELPQNAGAVADRLDEALAQLAILDGGSYDRHYRGRFGYRLTQREYVRVCERLGIFSATLHAVVEDPTEDGVALVRQVLFTLGTSGPDVVTLRTVCDALAQYDTADGNTLVESCTRFLEAREEEQ